MQHIDAADVEGGAFAAKQFDDGQADWIGAARRSCGENTVRAIVGGRSAEQVEALGAVELPEDHEMREAFDVGEAGLELGQEVENAHSFVLCAEAFGNVAGAFVGAGDMADGLRCEHKRSFSMVRFDFVERMFQGLKPTFICKDITSFENGAVFETVIIFKGQQTSRVTTF
jgi:hypothetical protein